MVGMWRVIQVSLRGTAVLAPQPASELAGYYQLSLRDMVLTLP